MKSFLQSPMWRFVFCRNVWYLPDTRATSRVSIFLLTISPSSAKPVFLLLTLSVVLLVSESNDLQNEEEAILRGEPAVVHLWSELIGAHPNQATAALLENVQSKHRRLTTNDNSFAKDNRSSS